jgi:hypothetical protein
MARHFSVLLVEDDDPLRSSLNELLQGWGWSVHATALGGEALELARRVPLDFSILDMHLRGADRRRPSFPIQPSNRSDPTNHGEDQDSHEDHPDRRPRRPQARRSRGEDPGRHHPAPFTVKVKDRVLFSSYAGTEVKIEGEEYVILSEDEILAIVE